MPSCDPTSSQPGHPTKAPKKIINLESMKNRLPSKQRHSACLCENGHPDYGLTYCTTGLLDFRNSPMFRVHESVQKNKDAFAEVRGMMPRA